MSWVKVCAVDEIPFLGARQARLDGIEIGIFKLSDGTLRAVENSCPHKGGPLSEGIVSGDAVICPLHSWKISLMNGAVLPPDKGNVKSYDVRAEDGMAWVRL